MREPSDCANEPKERGRSVGVVVNMFAPVAAGGGHPDRTPPIRPMPVRDAAQRIGKVRQ
jgi:hypothetical protein